jgi:hypothetical protein
LTSLQCTLDALLKLSPKLSTQGSRKQTVGGLSSLRFRQALEVFSTKILKVFDFKGLTFFKGSPKVALTVQTTKPILNKTIVKKTYPVKKIRNCLSL